MSTLEAIDFAAEEPKPHTISLGADASDEDEMEWEAVDGQSQTGSDSKAEVAADGPVPEKTITLHMNHHEKSRNTDRKSKKAAVERRVVTYAERMARIDLHKAHLLCSLATARIRNMQINNALLQARLLSMVPLHIAQQVKPLSPSVEPSPVNRSRAFERGMRNLLQWFLTVHRTDQSLATIQPLSYREASQLSDTSTKKHEIIRSSKSIARRALEHKSSRDLTAIIFAAYCRSLGIPTRLVVSLRPVHWRMGGEDAKSEVEAKTKRRTGKGKERSRRDSLSTTGDTSFEYSAGSCNDEDFEPVLLSDDMPQTPRKAPVKLRGSRKTIPSNLNSPSLSDYSATTSSVTSGRSYRPSKPSPTFWAEVFSRADSSWITVDCTRNLYGREARRMDGVIYAIALEPDHSGRDVTARYTAQFHTKISKMRLPPRKGEDWWSDRLQAIKRSYVLQRDEVEDAELMSMTEAEAMPQSLAEFKDHPRFVLARHVKRDEVVQPMTRVATFRGEDVYPRSNLHLLKSKENWLRSGRQVYAEELNQPMKEVPSRAVTIDRRRLIEAGKQSGHQVMDPLYGEWQTKLYIAPPIVNGEIPRNDFGNIDLYTPTMLPQGAIHLPQKGLGKIARKLGISYAEAVTRFEFRQQRATPVLEGIVVAEENAEAVLEAYHEWAAQQAIKEEAKKQARVIARWRRLIKGLQIRQRLEDASKAMINHKELH